MKKLLIVSIIFVLSMFIVTADCGPVCYGFVYESVYGPDDAKGESVSEPEEPEMVEEGCKSNFECNNGKHNPCNADGTEENYFCMPKPDSSISECQKMVKKSSWCSFKSCTNDEDCYLTTAITLDTFKDFDYYDCCNNTIGTFNVKSKEYWDRELKYYFRDYCHKQKLECREQIDISDYKAVCDKNECKITKVEIVPVTEKSEEPIELEVVKPKIVEEEKVIEEIPKEEPKEGAKTEEPVPVEETLERKEETFKPFTQRIFEWILSWFR